MSSEEMRRRRKLYLGRRTNTGSTFAFDELGEMKDPVKAICSWANLNLDDAEIGRLCAALSSLVEGAEDSDGLRPLHERAEGFAESTFKRRDAGARQAHDEALSYGQLTRGGADDAGYDKLFPDRRRLGEERPIFGKPAESWS